MKRSIQILAEIVIFILVLFLFKSCTKIEDKYRRLIIGEWKVYATSDGHGWFIQPNTLNLRTVFKKDGTYTRLNDNDSHCTGNYEIIEDSKIRFKPIDCFPPLDVTETIYKLTEDSLIISNSVGYLSSFIKDKYYRIK